MMMIILKADDLINIVVLKEGWSKTSANGNLASGEGRRSLIRNMISKNIIIMEMIIIMIK